MVLAHAYPPHEEQQARPPVAAPRILVVDDEPMVRRLIAMHLNEEGGDATGVGTGEQALAALDLEPFDLVILDVGLPGMSGFETCRQIRARSDVPVVFVTAAGSLAERLEGFDLGADDYVVKPMDAAELNRRVRAVLRRHGRRGEVHDLFGPDDVVVRVRAYEVFVGEREVRLTPKEFSVLRLLLERRGEVLTTDRISTEIWGYETFGSRNFVEAHVSRLRSKLSRAGASSVLTTVRGVGYVIR
jgi:DNA-binding response OmpR family regulator